MDHTPKSTSVCAQLVASPRSALARGPNSAFIGALPTHAEGDQDRCFSPQPEAAGHPVTHQRGDTRTLAQRGNRPEIPEAVRSCPLLSGRHRGLRGVVPGYIHQVDRRSNQRRLNGVLFRRQIAASAELMEHDHARGHRESPQVRTDRSGCSKSTNCCRSVWTGAGSYRLLQNGSNSCGESVGRNPARNLDNSAP